jgi:hypothetical protein
MKLRRAALVAASLVGLLGGCQDFLDVNTNPNAPETVAANLYLPPMLHWMVSGQHWDGRYTGQYTQNLLQTTRSTYGVMGPNFNTDAAGQQWRDVYWSFGQNLIDMMEIAEREKRWDVLGVGYVLKAWGWQALTDLHGDIIVKQAFDQTRLKFDYDDQEFVYGEVRRLLDSAFVYLGRTDGAVDASYLGRGDKIYNGNREKWLKFAHGLKAINLSHYNNKPGLYDPAAVIAEVDKSLASNADDALLPYTNTQNDDINFLGRSRGNFTGYRQSQFVVTLMDGTVFGAKDPRISRMLSPSAVTNPGQATPEQREAWQYHGLDVNVSGDALTAMPAATRPNNPYGYPASGGVGEPGLYFFADKVKMPAMTYAQLQFVKAEAAYHAGQKQVALDAYRNGIAAHIDFVNERNKEDGQLPPQITNAEKAAFLADPRVVPTNAADLTLSQIMSQKYIAQWAWAFNEQWMDMRRYHYTGLDPATGEQVYPGFAPPNVLDTRNKGKFVYRLRPRYNSEYVWNSEALGKIGGLDEDYHTKPLWILQP